MKAYVIKRDDGKYYVTSCGVRRKRNIFDRNLIYACKEDYKSEAEATIKFFNLQNCKVVPVEIKECEE